MSILNCGDYVINKARRLQAIVAKFRYRRFTSMVAPLKRRNEADLGKPQVLCSDIRCLGWIGYAAALIVGLGSIVNCDRDFGIDKDLRKPASWQWPPHAILEQQLISYLDQRTDNLLIPREQILTFWKKLDQGVTGPELFDHLLAVVGMIDDRFHRAVNQLNQTRPSPRSKSEVDLSWLDASVPAWIQANLQLALARGLAHHQLYDEAAQVLKMLNINQVADPSTLLFYRAITHHHLLQKDECLMAVNQLIERESELASRYAVTARLIKSDIEPLKEDSLDEISRLMNDVQRRLELGRSGKIVRDQEQQIVDKLDKMIDKIEQQIQEQKKRQQQQQQQSKDQKEPSQGKPMEDSQIAGNSGPGDVDPKSLGKGSGWGDLPPAQRQEALQNMTKDLPSHYREVIEAYFKTLATDTP